MPAQPGRTNPLTRGLPVVLLLLLGAGCGPDNEEVGRMLFVGAFCGALVGTGLLAVIQASWRPALTVHVPTRFVAAHLGVLALLATWAMARHHPDDIFGFGFLVAAPGYLTWQLVAWRIAFRIRPARAVVVASLVASVLLVVLGVMAILTPGREGLAIGAAVYLVAFPGIFGIPSAVVLVALLVEAMVRSARYVRANPREVTLSPNLVGPEVPDTPEDKPVGS